MQVLSMTECESVEGAGIPKIVVDLVMALSELDANAGQSGGQISDTPAA
jgi:hypothetical protein